MIICHCKGLTDREIRDAARRGARTSHQVADQCQAGSGCGGCVPFIEELLRGVVAHRPRSSATPPRDR